MRRFSNYLNDDCEVRRNLAILSDSSTLPEDYGKAFYFLGKKLSQIINVKINTTERIVIACSTEDADWLTKGILDNLNNSNFNIAVFWNLRKYAYNNPKLTIAPIIKSYIENVNQCNTLIICKSIIYTSCVVRTNLTYLITEIKPKKILIVAPVIFEGAENSLRKEFSNSISDLFEFYYFAIDNKVNKKGEVIPGIGGSIYERLGLIDSSMKNKYIPDLVKSRRQQNTK